MDILNTVMAAAGSFSALGVAIAINTLLVIPALLAPKKLLTPQGYVHAWVLGVVIWGSLGWRGYGVMLTYFLLGSGMTRIGQARKEALGIAEKRSGVRGPENVWGSAAVGATCALLAALVPLVQQDVGAIRSVLLLTLGYVASMATKLADTTASEVGKAYGQRTFLITTLKPVPRGTEGAVSLEGTLAGVAAGVLLSVLAWGLGLISLPWVGVSVLAAFVATNLESVIGATLQPRVSWLSNEWVNVINTALGATLAIALGSLGL